MICDARALYIHRIVHRLRLRAEFEPVYMHTDLMELLSLHTYKPHILHMKVLLFLFIFTSVIVPPPLQIHKSSLQ